MNFGQAFDSLLTREVIIRRKSWKDGVALALFSAPGPYLAWVTVGEIGAEPVSCLPAAELLADDWEVVS
ncbi:MAG: hypothetical protein EKK53_21420 [Burkholderiales bacterium]|nr:MAG: hypothetical protein EKK53_21420 [Burkholderiales bacterium]